MTTTLKDTDEYQTPKKYLIAAKEVMGSIDLDPASSFENSKRVPASHFFTIEQDGLKESWEGFDNVFLNPPYSKPNLTLWTEKLWHEFSVVNIRQAIYLVPAFTGERWFKLLFNYTICFVDHGIKFLLGGKVQSAPRFSNSFIYFGENINEFARIFSEFGSIEVRFR